MNMRLMPKSFIYIAASRFVGRSFPAPVHLVDIADERGRIGRLSAAFASRSRQSVQLRQGDRYDPCPYLYRKQPGGLHCHHARADRDRKSGGIRFRLPAIPGKSAAVQPLSRHDDDPVGGNHDSES